MLNETDQSKSHDPALFPISAAAKEIGEVLHALYGDDWEPAEFLTAVLTDLHHLADLRGLKEADWQSVVHQAAMRHTAQVLEQEEYDERQKDPWYNTDLPADA